MSALGKAVSILCIIIGFYASNSFSSEFTRDSGKKDKDWALPLLPPNFDEITRQKFWTKSNTYGYGQQANSFLGTLWNRIVAMLWKETTGPSKLIPRNLWTAFKRLPEERDLAPHNRRMLLAAKRSGWNVYYAGDEEIDRFMTQFFPNTSISWAYNMIHPKSRVAIADIWRYAALYAFGGFYIDDDADFNESLDKMIRPSDTLILSTEANPYENTCYEPTYRLSDDQLRAHCHCERFRDFFGGRYLLNWAMFSSARHPFMLQVLYNMVDIVRREFLGQGALQNHSYDRSRDIICATGPGVLTATAKVALLKHGGNISNFPMRLEKMDFAEFGGKFKSKTNKKVAKDQYYRVFMIANKPPLLKYYYQTRHNNSNSFSIGGNIT